MLHSKSLLREVRPRLRQWWPDILLGLLFFLLYAVTLARDVLPADAGEFQAVVPLLGVAHPPGFSLYTLLGKLFTVLAPVGSQAYRVNLFSAVTSVLTLVVVSRAVRALSPPSTGGPWGVWPGIAAATALGVSTTFWSQSTSANIRSMTGLFAALFVWAWSRFCRAASSEAGEPLATTTRALTAFAFVLSLGVVHHGSLAFMGAVLVLGLLLADPTLGRHPRRWIRPLLAGAPPLLVVLYLPWRGAAGAFLAPDHLSTWNGFLEHVLARGFEGDFFYFATWADLPDRLAILANIARFQFGSPLLALGLAGLGSLLWLRPRAGAVLAAAMLVHVFVSITYRAPQTVEYMLPAYVVAVIGAGAGLALLGEFATRNSRFMTRLLMAATKGIGRGQTRMSADSKKAVPVRARLRLSASQESSRAAQMLPGNSISRIACGILITVAAVSTLALALRNARAYAALARDTSTRDYAAGVLQAAPPGAAMLANWHWATPMWYLQQIEGLRPDVEVIYVFPQGTSLAQNWVERLHANVPERPTLVTSFYQVEYAASGYRFTPAGPAWRATDGAPDALPSGMTPLDVRFGARWRLLGYRTPAASISPGETFTVEAAWQSDAAPEPANFFMQLLGADGQLYGQDDARHPPETYRSGDILLDRYTLTVAATAPPGDYALTAGTYTPDGMRLTDPHGGEYTTLQRLLVKPGAAPPVTAHRVYRPGSLRGYDYDASLPGEIRLFLHWRLGDRPEEYVLWLQGAAIHVQDVPAGEGYLTTSVDLPADASDMQIVRGVGIPSLLSVSLADPTASDRYVPLGGSLVLLRAEKRQEADGSVRVDLAWQATHPLTEDDVVKVDLIGPDYAWRAQSDHIPAGGAIPTLKWIPGATIYDRHRLTPPQGADLASARFELAVYDHFTGRVLPIGDPRLARLGSTVTLFP